MRLVIGITLLLSFTKSLRAQDESDTIVAAPPSLSQDADDGYATSRTQSKRSTYEIPVLRQVADSTARSLQKQKEFAYANDPAYWKEEPKPREQKSFWDYFFEFFQSSTVRTIVYSLLIAFFLFVIYRIIVVNKLFLFYSSKKLKPQEEGEAVNIEDENWDEKIQKAIDANDHRMAVRYMYLKTLQLLNAKQWIQYHAEATNHEYVLQMNSRKQGSDFRFLTRIYDYVWYGEFALTAEQFDVVNNNFRHFYNTVNS